MGLIKKGALLACVMLLAAATGCGRKYTDDVRSSLGSMSLEQKVGQLLMTSVPGCKLNSETEEIVERFMPGGVILFGYNLDGPENIRLLINGLQEHSMRNSGIPLFISIDQEGGRVRRITHGLEQFPGNMAAGIAGAPHLVYKWGRITGLQLRKFGVNMNLAPVLDVNNNPGNPVINTRSFGSDPAIVAKMGSRYIRGLQKSGCIAVGKHFPGHGDTAQDSHVTLPVIPWGIDRLKNVEFVPFKKAIRSGVEGIMTAHISFPGILENSDPATLSPVFLTEILRNQMGFSGLVITDDMEMNAISGGRDMGEAAVMSLIAGTDIILISSYGKNINVIHEAVMKAAQSGRIPLERIDASVRRILECKFRYRIMSPEKGVSDRASPGLTEKEEKILDSAARVNRELSRRAIFYHGRKGLLGKDPASRRFVITGDPVIRSVLEHRSGCIVMQSVEDLYRQASLNYSGIKNTVFLHVKDPDLRIISDLAGFCKRKHAELVLVSTGNPFPVAGIDFVDSMLFSFSGTEESLRQVALCVAGEFMPAREINCYLGI